MRIVVTSDTHYMPQYHARLSEFIAEIATLKPDCFIMAGDVGERIEGFRAMMRLVDRLDCPRLILSGNHDLWARDGIDSEKLWREVLPQLTREHGAIWLEGENWIQGGVGVCGTNGWYDYSARELSIPMSDEKYYAMKRMYIVDGEAINWHWTDVEFANIIGSAFEDRLTDLERNPDIQQVLVATHVPAFEECLLRKPADFGWSVCNAYFGNLTLGARILKYRKVSAVVSGHTHVGRSAIIEINDRMIRLDVVPADYNKPAYVVWDV